MPCWLKRPRLSGSSTAAVCDTDIEEETVGQKHQASRLSIVGFRITVAMVAYCPGRRHATCLEIALGTEQPSRLLFVMLGDTLLHVRPSQGIQSQSTQSSASSGSIMMRSTRPKLSRTWLPGRTRIQQHGEVPGEQTGHSRDQARQIPQGAWEQLVQGEEEG